MTITINGKQYTGAIAREIEAALKCPYVQERGAFYVAKMGRHISADYYKREFLFSNTLGRLVSFVRNPAGDWVEVSSQVEADAVAEAPATEEAQPQTYKELHAQQLAACKAGLEECDRLLAEYDAWAAEQQPPQPLPAGYYRNKTTGATVYASPYRPYGKFEGYDVRGTGKWAGIGGPMTAAFFEETYEAEQPKAHTHIPGRE